MSIHQQRALPPLQQASSMGLKSRRVGGNRAFYSVEPLPERASSVPLRVQQSIGAPQRAATQHNSSDAPPANPEWIDRFFSSSTHPTVKGVSGWKTTLDAEKDRFHSVSTWGELMLQKVVRETSQLPSPNPLRTAVCCMLLHRITPLMGPGETLMKQLLHELYNAVYFSWSSYIDDKRVKGASKEEGPPQAHGGDGNTASSEYNYDRDALQFASIGERDNDPTTLKYFVSSLNHRFTYFQLLEELQKTRVKVVGLPSRVIVRCMGLWRHRLLQCIFTYWKGDTLRLHHRKKKIYTTVSTLFKKKCQQSLREHVLAWRAFVVERRHRNIQDHENTQKKLHQRMGRRIMELEAENTDLKQQLAELRTTHTAVVIQVTNMLSLLDKFRTVTAPVTEDQQRESSAPPESSMCDPDSSVPPRSESDWFTQCPPEEGGELLASALVSKNECHVEGPTEMQRQNVSALFPELVPPVTRRRSLTGMQVPETKVAEAEEEANKMVNGPNRFNQLRDFLDMDPLANSTNQQPDEKPTDVARKFHTRSDDTPATAAAASVVPFNYSDVLDWVSVRTQLLVMTIQPNSQGLRRCTNFTIDFRDSIRLACLLVSLGGDRSLVDDVAAIPDLEERAALTLKVCQCFFDESDASWEDVQRVGTQDIVRAKGGRISKLMFALFRKFHDLPASVPTGPPTAQISAALQSAGFSTALCFRPISMLEDVPVGDEGNSSMAPSPMHKMERSHFGEFVEETIPDTQFASWFRELAASDSDDDATNFFDVTLGGSVTGSVSEKMHRRMSRLSFHGSAPSSPTSKRWKKKSKNQELTEAMVRWVRQKISLQHEGRDVPSFSSMSSADVLFCVLQSMFPKMSFEAKEPLLKLKRMQECLSKKLHLTKVTLGKELLRKRDRFTAEEDIAVPLKELLLMLFFYDQEIVVNM